MGKQYKSLSKHDIDFINNQKLFYIASCSEHEVNLSPRGYDSIYVHDASTLYMIDYLGSGNRTARDISLDAQITLLFNAFEDKPKILRCFCKGECHVKGSKEFKTLSAFFNADMRAIRQIFTFNIYAVESSCGMGVPLMQYKEDRQEVKEYALDLSEKGLFDSYVEEHITPPDISSL